MGKSKGSRKAFRDLKRRSKSYSDEQVEWIDTDEVEWFDSPPIRGNKGVPIRLPKKRGGRSARGVTNGLAIGKGFTNGRGRNKGRVNGLTNGAGLTNGRGRVKGAGLTTARGRVNGLINGNGLTNGFGLINGGGIGKNIRMSFVRSRAKPILKALFVFAVFLIPTIMFFLYIDDDEYITIDGKFGDWNGVTSYRDSLEDQVNNSDVNIIEYRMDRDNDLASFYLRVDGGVMGGAVSSTEASLDTVQIFIDSDQDKATGYSIGGLGADHMIDISGYNGSVIDAKQMKFEGDGRKQSDWNGWETVIGVKAEATRDELETQFWLPENEMPTNDLDVYFRIGDSDGNEDFSDGVISTKPGVLVVRQRSIASDILTEGIEDVLELELTARGKSITVDSIIVTNTGTGEIPPIHTPITVEEDETYTHIVPLNTYSANPGDLIDVKISSADDISVNRGKVSLIGDGAKAYFERAPGSITIDGAFGDWANIGATKDLDTEPVRNDNVDINEYKIDRGEMDISFYFSVQGRMMGGTRIPMVPRFFSFFQPTPPPAPENQTTPTIDPVYIRPELRAEDTLFAFIDNDNNDRTGYAVSRAGNHASGLGADHMIKITGKNGRVVTGAYYRFNGSHPSDWNWRFISNIRTGNDAKRLETQIEYSLIGLQPGEGFGISFYAHDWNKGSEDRTDDKVFQGPDWGTSSAPGAPEGDTDDDEGQQEGGGSKTRIHLRAGTFDPLTEDEPNMDEDLVTETSNGYHILQFTGPIREEWKKEIEDMGGTFYGYIPDYAFILRIEDRLKLNGLPYVRWAGDYHPVYKAEEGILDERTGDVDIDVLVFREREQVAKRIEELGGVIKSKWDSKLCININSSDIKDILFIPDVEWVEQTPIFKINNNVSDDLERLNVAQVWDSPSHLTGTGQIVAVCDTGLDNGVIGPDMIDDIEGNVIAIYDSLGGWDDGTDDVASGHGTHVSGSVLGNGANSSGEIKGMAPCASLVFQASEFYYEPDTAYYLDLPSDLNVLFQQAYDAGARIHTNSWGSDVDGRYTSYSQDLDEFTWANRDMLIVFSAGNEGVDGNSNGIVDYDSMQSPATSKNGLTVGASENVRSDGGSQSSYGASWPGDFPADPINSDHKSNNSEGMVGFSSRGPCDDGRIKPDVVAPGTNVLSTRSSKASGTLWGVFSSNTDYLYCGGTSMSAPLVAGCSVLVRQFYTDKEGLESPSCALIKATLINGATDMKGQYDASHADAGPIPNNDEGWGRVNVTNSIYPTSPREMTYEDVTSGFDESGTTHTYKYRVGTGEPLKITLAYSDHPGTVTSGGLVNDLDLKVTAPDGSTYYLGNDFSNGWTDSDGSSTDSTNNVECVYIEIPSEGIYTVNVTAQNIAVLGSQSDQDYALVVSGNFTFPNDVGVDDIEVNKTQLKNTKARIDATIKNYGKNDQSGFNARCVVKNPYGSEVLNTTQTITSISSKSTVNKTFYYTPTSEGVHTITVQTELSTDDANENNASTVYLTVPLIMNEIAAISGTNAGDLFGFNVTSGTLNDDDYGDVIVGAPGANKTYIFYGYNIPWNGRNLYASNANVTLTGPYSDIGFGWSVGVSDVTGDGYDDVIVGAPGNNSNVGAAYIYHSSATGLPDTIADVNISGGKAEDRFGSSVSGAGDINNKDFEEVIIGAYLNDTLYGSRTDAGMAYVFFGDSGLSGNLSVTSADLNISGQEAGDHFGFSVSSAGDVNNDAYSDIIVGAPSAGKAYIYYGHSSIGAGGNTFIIFEDGFESGSITTKGWTAVNRRGTYWKTQISPSPYDGTFSGGSLLESGYLKMVDSRISVTVEVVILPTVVVVGQILKMGLAQHHGLSEVRSRFQRHVKTILIFGLDYGRILPRTVAM
jgi:hypothetical protein